MRYLPEATIEARASELWQRHGLAPGFDVERLLDDLRLGLVWEPVDDDNLGGRVLGQLIPEQRLVVLNERHLELLEDKDGRLGRYTVGHEVGHWEFHAEAARSGTLNLLDGDRIWRRSDSTNLAERQAEMFSAAMLMPRHELLAALPKASWKGWRPVYMLADTFLVNITPMTIRLEKLGWMHRDEDGIPVSGPANPPGQQVLFGA
jgi:hypothetical protein